MKNMMKLLCLLLALVICMGAFAACNGDKDKDKDKDKQESETDEVDESDDETDPEVTIPENERDDLGEYNFGGEYVVLSRGTTKYEFASESGLTGAPVKDAIYERNEYVMERCGVEISVLEQPGDWGDRDSFMASVRANGLVPQSEWDLIATHQAYLATLSIENLGLNFADITNIDLSKVWWSEAFYNDANINGDMYIMYGDIAYTLYEYMMVIFFNENLATDLAIDDLYDVALDGDWTWEVFTENVTKVTTDLNAAEDQITYGFLTNGHSERQAPTGFNIDLAPYDEAAGRRKIPMIMPLSMQTPLQAYIDFILDTDQVRRDDGGDNSKETQNPIFESGRALFYMQMLGQATQFKHNMEDDYGVLPFPKWNDSQVEYRTGVRDTVTGILMPNNVKNEEMAGTVTEMLCMESFNQVVDVYYEEALKYQSFNNPDCVEMLDTIRASFNPSFSAVYSFSLDFHNSLMGEAIADGGKVGIATHWSTDSLKHDNLLKTVYAAFEEMAGN